MIGVDINLRKNCSYFQKKNASNQVFVGKNFSKTQLIRDEFVKSIPFTSNEINVKDDKAIQDYDKIVDEIVKEYYDYKEQCICTGTTFLFDDRDAFLYRKLCALINDDNDDVVRVILNRLNLIGPVGKKENTYCSKEIPIFAYAYDEKYQYCDSVEIFKNYMNKTKTKQEKFPTAEDREKYEIEMRLDNIEKKKELEDKKEIFKVQLRTFVERLGNSAFGESALLPNCIMLLCEDKEVVYEVANWLKEVSSVTDFQYIQGKYNDLNLMQDKLISTLEEAEKNYQETGRRSIIFVPNMSDLINKEKNSPENIAEMKLYMQLADDDYHSTILFASKNAELPYLEKGALQPNRVGIIAKI